MPQKRRAVTGRSKKKPAILRIKLFTLPPLSEIALTIGRAAIIASIFVIPLILTTQHQNPFAFSKYIAVVITTVTSGTMLLIFYASKEKKQLLQSPLVNIVIILLLSYILAAIFSHSPIVSMFGSREAWHVGLIGITAFTALTLITANLFSDELSVRFLLWMLTVSGMLIAIVFLYSNIIMNISREDSLLYGITEDGSQSYASILAITAAVTAVMIFMYEQINMKGLFALLSLIQVLAIFISGEVVIGVLCVAITAIIVLPRIVSKRTPRLFVSVLILAVSAVILRNELTIYVESLAEQIENTWILLSDNALTGVGPGMVAFFERGMSSNGAIISNMYANLIAAGGICTLIPITLLVARVFLEAFTPKGTITHTTIVAGSMVWIITHVFITPTATTMLFGAVILAALAAQSNKAAYIQRKNTRMHRYAAPAIFIAGSILTYSILRYADAETLYQQSTLSPNSEALTSITKAIEIHPFDDTYHHYRATLLSDFLIQNSDSVDIREVRRNIEREIQFATGINEYNPDTYIAAARIYNTLFSKLSDNNILMTGISYASIGVQKDPYSPIAYTTRATILANAQRFDAASSDIDHAISLDSSYWPAYFTGADISLYKSEYSRARSYLSYVIENADDVFIKDIATSRLESIPE